LYIAILLFFFGVFLWPWLFAAFSAMFVGWSLVARTEGYGNRCVECDHACPRYPWSL
jgi:hypothetical protein